ncbi:hypothetical protein AAFF_G00346340, partial [Aldrovandia affinis]
TTKAVKAATKWSISFPLLRLDFFYFVLINRFWRRNKCTGRDCSGRFYAFSIQYKNCDIIFSSQHLVWITQKAPRTLASILF